MKKGKWWDFYFTCSKKTDSTDAESWSPSEKCHKACEGG